MTAAEQLADMCRRWRTLADAAGFDATTPAGLAATSAVRVVETLTVTQPDRAAAYAQSLHVAYRDHNELDDPDRIGLWLAAHNIVHAAVAVANQPNPQDVLAAVRGALTIHAS